MGDVSVKVLPQAPRLRADLSFVVNASDTRIRCHFGCRAPVIDSSAFKMLTTSFLGVLNEMLDAGNRHHVSQHSAPMREASP